MDTAATPDSLDQLLTQTFTELGVSYPVVRTLLLRDGSLAGHKFSCEGVRAVWLVGSDEIAFDNQDGVLLKTVKLEAPEQKKVA